MQAIPAVLHKYLKPRNTSQGNALAEAHTNYFLRKLQLTNNYHNFLFLFKQAAANSSQNTSNDRFQMMNLSDIQRSIERYNEYQTIINEDVFGPLQNDSIIIVIQVHQRITYLRHLIISLAQARDMSKALLIFSHDFYDEEINELVQSIDFCKVMQIFYPFSIQTHPNEFPGTDPKVKEEKNIF